jgi:hypothetical protein
MRLSSLVFVVLVATTAPAFAQTGAEGAIRGVVKDSQGGVLPGTTVDAATTTGASVVAVTDAVGEYRLLGLAPGTYTITAALDGFGSYVQPGVVVRAGLNLGLDVVLRVGGLTETVQVTVETPLLEVRRPVQAINVSGELQRMLPLSGRKDFSDFLELTPGVVARSLDQGSGGQVYMLRGSEIDNHVIQIDGADIGSFRQGLAGGYIGLSLDAIADTQIKTGGTDASAPLGVGVIVNVVTRSGADRFDGSASTIYQGERWNDRNTANGVSADAELFQIDSALGGPVIPRKLSFFAAFRYADRRTGIARTADQLAALTVVDPAFHPFTNGGRTTYEFVKATAQFSPSQQLYAFFQRDFNPEVAALPTDARPFSIGAFGGNAFAARWSSIWGTAATTRVLATYNDKSFNGTFDAFDNYLFAGPERDVFTSSFVSGGRRVGSGLLGRFDNIQSLRAEPASKATLQADLSYFVAHPTGSHELQAGVLAQPRLAHAIHVRYPNGGAALEHQTFVDPASPSAGLRTFYRRVYDAASATSSARVASDYAVYLNDVWKVKSGLTIDAGVRVDRIVVRDDVYRREVQRSWEIGPRVGATYVMTADGRHVLRANYARVADLPQPLYLPSAGGNPLGFTDYYDNDLNGVFETVLPSPPVTPESSNLRVDPGRHQPYLEEWIGGYRRQWPRQFSMDVSVIRRAYRDRPGLVEINRILDGTRFVGYRDESQNDIFLVTNNRWNTPVYTGLELSLAKRGDGVDLLAGYTRGWQHLDGTWVPGDPAALIQPDAFANDRGIGSIRGNEQNSLSGTADTRGPAWRRHTFRAGAAYTAPWGLLLATNVVLVSGPFSGPIVTRVAASDPAFGEPIVTLSNGRRVSNPLATTIRFAYDDRGEGQIEAPSLFSWNLRVGRDVRLGRGGRLTLTVDLLNLTNHAADQEFQVGGNQLFNTATFAIAPDGSFRGQARQAPRSGQVGLRYSF